MTTETVTTRAPTIPVTYRWVPVPGTNATELRMFQGNFDLRLVWVRKLKEVVQATIYYAGESDNQKSSRDRTELSAVALCNIASRLGVALLADGIVMPALTDDCFTPGNNT